MELNNNIQQHKYNEIKQLYLIKININNMQWNDI